MYGSEAETNKRLLVEILVVLVSTMAALDCGSTCLGAQDEETASRPGAGAPGDDTPRELVYPYYSLRRGYGSTLVLMDRAPRPIEFTIAVHGQSGQTVLAKPMNIQPQERLEVNLQKLFDDLHVDFRGDFVEGSLSVLFKGRGNPLGGRLIVEGPDESFNIGPAWTENESGESMLPRELNSLWWDLGGSRDAKIVVTNTSADLVTAEVYLDFQGMRHIAAPLKFTPHASQEISIIDTLASLRLTAYQAPAGGVSIIPRESKAVLIALGKMTDPEEGNSTTMSFPLPQLQLANALHATGVPISIPSEDSPFAEMGNFVPHVILRNLTDAEQTITLTVEYPGKSGPQQTPLPPIRLNRYTTQDVRLDSYFSALPLPLPFCSIRIQHNGLPGSIIAEVIGVDEQNYEVNDIGVANEGNGYAGSLASYWSIDAETDVVLFLTNMGEKECPIGFQIQAGGVTYHLTKLKLIPHETQFINFRELRDKQEPDFKGNKIPIGATEGRVQYIRLDLVPVMGRLVEVRRRRSEANNSH